MKKIKRIKVKESIDLWNDKNPIKIKKTGFSVSNSIGINNIHLSLWNNGKVSKSIQAIYDASVYLDMKFDDLFESVSYPSCDDSKYLKRIALKENIERYAKTRRKRNFAQLSQLIPYAEWSLRSWDKGELPYAIVNFYNFCIEVELKPSQVIEF